MPSSACRLLALLSLAFLAGCARFRPSPIVPDAELRGLLQRSEVPPDVTCDSVAANSVWFPIASEVDLKDGISLDEANALALFYSPELREYRARRKIAGLEVVRAGLLRNPEIFLGPRLSTEDAASIFPFSLSMELPLFGTRAAQREKARVELERANWELIGKELEVLQAVREAFIALGTADEAVGLFERDVKIRSGILRWARALYESAAIDALTYQLAAIEDDEARQARTEAIANKKRARLEVLATIGLMPSTDVQLVTDSAIFAVPPSKSGAGTRLLEHPFLRAAEAAYAGEDYALAYEIARQIPVPSLGLEGESDRGELSLGIGLKTALPIFDWNRTGVAMAESRRLIAREGYKAALLHLAKRQMEAEIETESLSQRLEELEKARSRTSDAEKSLEARLAGGDADVLEVITARGALTRLRIRKSEVTAKLALARLALGMLTGESFSPNLSLQPEDKKNLCSK